MSEGVTITFEMKLKPEAAAMFPQMGPQILASPSEFPGFRSLRIVQHKDDPTRIMFIEKWDREEDYKAYIAERYGAPPEIRYFETPVVVDNESDKILADAA